MDSLLAELDRKRKQLDDNKATSKKKFVKRSELAQVQLEEQERKRNERLKEKGLLTEPGDQDGSESTADEIKKTLKIDKDQKYKNIDKSELIKRLREKGEPIKFFGESHEDTCQRLRLAEMMSKDKEDKGSRNDFKAAMDRVDQSYMAQLETRGQSTTENRAHDVKISDGVLSMERCQEMAATMEKNDMQANCKLVLELLKLLSYEWGKDLNARELHEKISVPGKLSTAQYSQTMEYLKPLFRKLRSISLTADILNALTGIARHLMDREYVKASDMYLQMAIGNAPWPIGVTNPGIHARTGREKISTALVAHVLNDETQRKYIQALKRLMTYCQKRYLAAPSKCVEYQGGKNTPGG